MKTLSKVLLATALAVSAAPAFAQEMHTLEERNLFLFTADGRMIQMKASDTQHAMIMKDFKRLPNTVMIYASGGHLYMANDHKMDGGKMLSTEVFGKDLGISSQH